MNIKIKYHDKMCKIKKIDMGDWIDLHSAETVHLYPGNFKYVSLGVSMQLPEGYEAHLVPRSSSFKSWGILQPNSPGIIDNTFCGDTDVWHMPVYATRETTICKGDRICQFRIVKSMDSVKFTAVDSLGNEARNGFGSTGNA
jgi:dUTP pyrophosphatase